MLSRIMIWTEPIGIVWITIYILAILFLWCPDIEVDVKFKMFYTIIYSQSIIDLVLLNTTNFIARREFKRQRSCTALYCLYVMGPLAKINIQIYVPPQYQYYAAFKNSTVVHEIIWKTTVNYQNYHFKVHKLYT